MARNKFLYFVLVILLGGCSTTSALHNLSGNTANGLEPNKSEFIELNDGTIIEGEIINENLRKTHALFSTKGSATIAGKKYDYKDIKALQDDNVYYIKTPHNTFARRIVKGRINVFRTYHDATNSKGASITYQQHFIQKGETGAVSWFEVKILEQMISDYQPAIDKLNEYKGLKGSDKRFRGDSYLDDAISIYNSQR